MLQPISDTSSGQRYIRLPIDLSLETTLFPDYVYLLSTLDPQPRLHSNRSLRNVCLLFDVKLKDPATIGSQTAAPRSPEAMRVALGAARAFDPYKAWEKVRRSDGHFDPFRSVKEFLALLRSHAIRFQENWIDDLHLYLGNAWDEKGEGLFDDDVQSNADKAFLFWLQHTILPQITTHLKKDHSLTIALLELCAQHRLEVPAGLVERLNRGSHRKPTVQASASPEIFET